ncbi:hypothetical protein T02_7609 [Trichinella nativa]|uniref:Uncharacterized protein n=1 Tax=Trichinella nativa TaxID=6335 RepID=A0A0V1KJY2_9BILA|nr:hypothetical protein T02_7609 [Trichinella nativa]
MEHLGYKLEKRRFQNREMPMKLNPSWPSMTKKRLPLSPWAKHFPTFSEYCRNIDSKHILVFAVGANLRQMGKTVYTQEKLKQKKSSLLPLSSLYRSSYWRVDDQLQDVALECT